MEKALPLDVVDYDPSVEESGDVSNMTAEQYLSWVRYQASCLPLVTRAVVDMKKYVGRQTAYMPPLEDIASCSDAFAPNEKWETDALKSFSDLRGVFSSCSSQIFPRLISLPPLRNPAAWHLFCLGEVLPLSRNAQEHVLASKKLELMSLMEFGEVDEEGADCGVDVDIDDEDDSNIDGKVSGVGNNGGVRGREGVNVNNVNKVNEWTGAVDVPPSMSLLLQMDQVLTQRLLSFHIHWLRQKYKH